MKKLLLATAATLILAPAAFAADAIIYAEPAPVAIAAPSFSWAGAYAGVNAGYMWSDVDFTSPPPALDGSMSPNGFVGGVQAGYNWQFDSFVLGVEAGASIVDVSDSVVLNGIGSASKGKWIASAKLRAGYAVDNWLFYVSGGGVMAGVEGTATVPGLGSDTQKKTLNGWTAGLGVEAFVTENISARLDYAHIGYGKKDFAFFGDPAVSRVKTSANMVTVGLNYHF